jgi:hypothetical protein
MTPMFLLMAAGSLAVPAVALWALRWAVGHGEFQMPERAALLPFDEAEPVGEATDIILNQRTSKR